MQGYKGIQGIQGIEGIRDYTGCTKYTGFTKEYTVYRGIQGALEYTSRVYKVYKGVQGVLEYTGVQNIVAITYLGTIHGGLHEILTRHRAGQNHRSDRLQ